MNPLCFPVTNTIFHIFAKFLKQFMVLFKIFVIIGIQSQKDDACLFRFLNLERTFCKNGLQSF